MDAHLALFVMEEQIVLLLGKFLRASAGTDDHAEPPQIVERKFGRIKARTGERFTGSRDREWKDARDVPAVFLVHPGEFVETGDFAGNLNVKFAGIKARDPPQAAAAFENRFRKSRAA